MLMCYMLMCYMLMCYMLMCYMLVCYMLMCYMLHVNVLHVNVLHVNVLHVCVVSPCISPGRQEAHRCNFSALGDSAILYGKPKPEQNLPNHNDLRMKRHGHHQL